MAYQNVFERYELKYLLSKNQKQAVLQAISKTMELDKYGRTTIRNLYYDTDTYLLIRRSIERPEYKEKLRVRSYGKATSGSPVFVELKKKYKSVVYKRRISMPHDDAISWLSGNKKCIPRTQISDEINYFLEYYKTLHPTAFLSYEREAYYSNEREDFRVTFDENIFVRESDLSLCADLGGASILPENTALMEIKCSSGIPLWMTEVLTKEKIYKTSFSKYGTGYKEIIFPHLQKFKLHSKELIYHD